MSNQVRSLKRTHSVEKEQWELKELHTEDKRKMEYASLEQEKLAVMREKEALNKTVADLREVRADDLKNGNASLGRSKDHLTLFRLAGVEQGEGSGE